MASRIAETKEKPIDPADFLPIIIHYYNGRFGSLQTFGHVAIQFGKYYLSYGGDDTDVCFETTNFTHRIAAEEKAYGLHNPLNLSDVIFPKLTESEKISLAHNLELLKNFYKSTWKPREYTVRNHNCADFTADICSKILDLARFDRVRTDQLRMLVLPEKKLRYNRPAQVNQILSDAIMESKEIQIHTFRKESSAAPPPSVKIFVTQLLDHVIERLMQQRFKDTQKSAQLKKTQDALVLLITLHEKIPELSLRELQKSIESILPDIEETHLYAAENLGLCLAQLSQAIEAKEDEAIYTNHHKKDVVRRQAISDCQFYYSQLKNFLGRFQKPESEFQLGQFCQTQIERNEKMALTQAQKGIPVSLENYHQLFNLINLCFYEFSFDSLFRKIHRFTHDQLEDLKFIKGEIERLNHSMATPPELKAITDRFRRLAIRLQILAPGTSAQADKIPDAMSLPQIQWFNMQVRNIHYWQRKQKSPDILLCQDLAIECYQLEHKAESKSAYDAFRLMAQKMENQWQTLAIANLKKPEQQTDKRLLELFTKNPQKYSLIHELGLLILEVRGMQNHPAFDLLHIRPDFGSLEELNPKLAVSKYINALLEKLIFIDIPSLPDKLSTKEHLTIAAKQIQQFVKTKAITPEQALETLIAEIFHAADFAARDKSPDKQYSRQLESIKVNMVIALPEPQNDKPKRILEMIKEAIEDKKNTEQWKNAAIRKDKIIMDSDQRTVSVPQDIKRIYQILGDLDDPRKNLEKLAIIMQLINLELHKPGLVEQLTQSTTFGNPPVPIIFLMGILALQREEKIPESKNPFAQICHAGQRFLPIFMQELKQPKLTDIHLETKKPAR